ncbi:MAG: TolC family protein [Desulfobulbaceae bacterium]|nr:TolC family protein [Desulfobulbaceae bacterium]
MSILKHNIKRMILCFIVLTAIASPAQSRETVVLKLDDAILKALNNNSQTKIAKMELTKANAAVKEAFGYALPTVDFSASLSHFLSVPKMPFPDFEAMLNNYTYKVLVDEALISEGDAKYRDMSNSLQSFTLKNNYEAKLQVTQILFNSAVFRGIGASEIYRQAAEVNLQNTAAKTILDVQKAFYGILLAKEMNLIAQSSFENIENHVKSAQAMFQQGLASEYNVMQAEVQLENFRPMVIASENALKNAKEGLRIVLGIGDDVDIDVVGNLEVIDDIGNDLPNLIEKARKNNLDVKGLSKKADVDEAFIDLDVSEYWPSLVAFGNVSLNGASDDFNFLHYNSSMVGVSLSINLFNGNRTRQKVEQSTVSMLQTREQVNNLKDFVAMRMKDKFNELEQVRSTLSSQERNVDLAQKSYSIAEVRFKEGTGTQLELLSAELQLRQARANRLQSVYAFINAKADIENLTGKLSEEYINLIMNNNK